MLEESEIGEAREIVSNVINDLVKTGASEAPETS
jgi:hypothetical protein